MDMGAMAWTAIILAVVILSLTFVPNASSLAILILLGMIKKKIKKTADRPLPFSGPVVPGAPLGHHPPPRGRTWPFPSPPSPGGAPPLAGGASPPAGPPPAVDARVPSGKKRSEPESSSTPSSSSGFEHVLFLNCGDSEINSPFMADLNRALENARIRVFRGDDVEREPHWGGEFMSRMSRVERMDRWLKQRELIKRSRISIAILSEYFATTKRCLDELVQMWEGRESNGQIIIPIFYDVSRSDVKYLGGDFGRRFNLHEMVKVDPDTIQKWRDVLRQIGRLRGFIRENLNWDDSQLIKIVVKSVGQVLRKDDLVVPDILVGIDHHVQEMMSKLGVAYSEGQAVEVRGEEVHVVVIQGARRVGKTTLAKVVFNKMRKLFDACSFLENIKSEGVQFSRHRLVADLQKQKPEPLESSGEEIANLGEEIAKLCANVRVLIVLDRLDKDEDIVELGDLTLFRPGSRIIVTTNERQALIFFEDAAARRGAKFRVHEVGPMSDENALELFHMHVFQGAAAEDVSEYDSLSRDIVKATGRLPSDIVDRASYLRRNMNMDTWKTTLHLLREKFYEESISE